MTLNTIYLICAIAGGTILVLRIILTVIGLDHGADAVDTVDVGHDDVGHVTDGPRWRRHGHEPTLPAIPGRLLHHVWAGGPGPAASPTGPHLEPIGRAGRRRHYRLGNRVHLLPNGPSSIRRKYGHQRCHRPGRNCLLDHSRKRAAGWLPLLSKIRCAIWTQYQKTAGAFPLAPSCG